MRLKVAAIPFECTPSPPQERLLRIDTILGKASAAGARLMTLPEMSLVGYDYSARNYEIAESVPGPLTESLAELALKHGVVVIAGLVERDANDLFNTLVVVDQTGYRGKYKKVHVSTFENACWKAGDEPGVVETEAGRIGLGICSDILYPTPWKWYGEANVDLVVIASAWPDLRGQRSLPFGKKYKEAHYRFLKSVPEKISRAVGAPVVVANCIGEGVIQLPVLGLCPSVTFAGGSHVVGGENLEDGNSEFIVAEVNIGSIEADDALWEGPWLPETDWFTRSQFYGVEAVSRAVCRQLYRWKRRSP